MDQYRNQVDRFLMAFNSMSALVKIHMIMFDVSTKTLSFSVSLEIYDKYLNDDKYGSMNNFVHLSQAFFDQIHVISNSYFGESVDWDEVNQIGMVKVAIK
jgi:hypothetical protein